ncbi:MAG: hypothetical protein U9Q06_01045 [Nanoarchaeota archaeon]|nr:hypothetical protein [Nanoarchaeota archaeon]
MKKLFSLLTMFLLMLAIMPVAFADGDDIGGGIGIIIGDPNSPPEIFVDSTQRSWYPNDQTYYTAELYNVNGPGGVDTNDYCDLFYDVGMRGDYVFAGETVTNYVLVVDEDGEDDIAEVILQLDDMQVGPCVEIDPTALGCGGSNWTDGDDLDQFETGLDFDDATMNLYRCQLIVDSTTGVQEMNIMAIDTADNDATTVWSEFLKFNPDLMVSLTGDIDFGDVEAGTTVTSNTISLNNEGDEGVVMDMYIASDDYFTDPSGLGSCGSFGMGIPYWAFSYYASKGSVDSGSNLNQYPGLGESSSICEADVDEYTPLPSHSGEIWDMCRIINHQIDGSALVQGQSMNIRFQLDIPLECVGSFNEGEFHFVGRVV